MSLTFEGDGTISGFDAGLSGFGGLVAVHYVEKTDTFSASLARGSNTAVTGLSLSNIAVSDAANRLIITAFFGAAGNSTSQADVGIAVYDGTGFLSVGDANASSVQVTAGGRQTLSGDTVTVANPHMTIVHTPGTTSPKTYTAHVFNVQGSTRTVYVNRTAADSGTDNNARTASALLIQEVSV